MTSPANAKSVGSRRVYTHPGRDDGREYASVTTIIREGVPKPLDNWFKKITAEYAVDQHHQWADLPRDQAVALIKKAADRVRDDAGQIGDAVHTHLEHLAQGSTPPDLMFAEPAAIDSARQGELFLAEWAPRFHRLEHTVYSDRHGYAGSFDFIADLPGLGLVIGDYKTSKGIYSEVGLQLAAYRYADHMVDDQGNELPIPAVNGGVAVHIRPDGYQVVPVECGEREHAEFLAALSVAEHRRRKDLIGRPLEAPANIAQIRRRNLEDRICTLRQIDGALVRLAEVWPENIPTLKQSDGHTVDQLAIVGYRVADVEKEFEAPFNPPPNLDGHTLEPAARPEPVNVPAGSKERHDRLAGRIVELPPDLIGQVETAATLCGCPNLGTGRATDSQLDQVEAAISDAEHISETRHGEVTEAFDEAVESEQDLVDAILALADTAGGPYTALEAERTIAVAHAVEATAVDLVADDDGWHVRPSSNVLLRLEQLVGPKSKIVEVAKVAARRHGLPVPKSTAVVAADPLLVALTLEHSRLIG